MKLNGKPYYKIKMCNFLIKSKIKSHIMSEEHTRFVWTIISQIFYHEFFFLLEFITDENLSIYKNES